MELDRNTGLLRGARYRPSPNCDQREYATEPEAVIVHCISLPPGEYGGDHIEQFFTNSLDPSEHPYFESIKHLRVSAHFLIRRDGSLCQFVSTEQRAWHAGESYCLSRPKVNDFSIGVELEGLDTDVNGFTNQQYAALGELIAELQNNYPAIKDHHVFAHSDISPGRKPDPGPYFEWRKLLKQQN